MMICHTLNPHITNVELMNLQKKLNDDLPYTKSLYYKCSTNLQKKLNDVLIYSIRAIIGHRKVETGRKVIFLCLIDMLHIGRRCSRFAGYICYRNKCSACKGAKHPL
jgi:hypothetical protein